MRGQPGHYTRPHARLSTSIQRMDAWMASQMYLALIHKQRGSFKCLADFMRCYPRVLAQPDTG